jgi:Arc/MetJ-type ribon-helix-helix transcriptional regulator
MSSSAHRCKLSTTVSRQTYGFLDELVRAGRAASIAEAVDIAVEPARQAESRAKLERDTSAYFDGMPYAAAAQEAQLGAALSDLIDEVDLDAR